MWDPCSLLFAMTSFFVNQPPALRAQPHLSAKPLMLQENYLTPRTAIEANTKRSNVILGADYIGFSAHESILNTRIEYWEKR